MYKNIIVQSAESFTARVTALAVECGFSAPRIVRAYDPELALEQLASSSAPFIIITMESAGIDDSEDEIKSGLYKKMKFNVDVFLHVTDRTNAVLDAVVNQSESLVNSLAEMDNWTEPDGTRFWISDKEMGDIVSPAQLNDNIAYCRMTFDISGFSE